MLTRFQVTGFKNLIDIDLSFGPFTCIAGLNAVGKSNLFDAIMFMGALADQDLLQAAMQVRDRAGRATDIRSLFHARESEERPRLRMRAEMIVPEEGLDDLGQVAKASITFLTYTIEIAHQRSTSDGVRPGLEILEEELSYINLSDADAHLPFHPNSKWVHSVIRGKRSTPFISTFTKGEKKLVRLRQERHGGRPREFAASTLPRTVLSTVNALESPTALLARRELRSWRLLQLEPSSLRAPDPFIAPPQMDADGAHLPATLFRLSHGGAAHFGEQATPVGNSLGLIGSRLARLVDDVKSVEVQRDDSRELLTLVVETKDGTKHPARSLSDGTLRFLALAALEADQSSQGLLCLEEPENGIHPERIRAILDLLQDLSVKLDVPVGPDNPLRQVIINTHSPTVVSLVPEDSLLWAEPTDRSEAAGRVRSVVFRPLYDTWRQSSTSPVRPVQKGKIISFLQPVRLGNESLEHEPAESFRRVIEREELGQLRLWSGPHPLQANE